MLNCRDCCHLFEGENARSLICLTFTRFSPANFATILITPKKLILWEDHPDARWATPDTVAIWKAQHLATLRHTDQIKLYAESDPRQAATIAEAAKMPVICPVARRVFGIEYLPDL